MWDVLAALPSAVTEAFTFSAIFYLLAGSLLGFVFGALPGLGGVAAMALLIPFSYSMDPHNAMMMFAGAMGAVAFGGSIPAILLNVPGTPQNMASAFDGYPMAQQGKAGQAIGASATSAVVGSLFGVILLVVLIPMVRSIILSFGPPEFLMLILFGLISIPLLTGKNFIGGMLAGCFGLSLSFIGFSGTLGVLRYNFGTMYLFEGLGLTTVVMGLFAVSQAIELIFSGGTILDKSSKIETKMSDVLEGIKAPFRFWKTTLRSSSMGTLIGIIPGMGGVIANIYAWVAAAQASPNKDKFGTGEVEGVVASESAINAKDGGALLPTLAFGIPGSGEMAILMSALILQGIAPGPQLLRERLDLAWALILGLILSNVIVSFVGILSAKHVAKIAAVRGSILGPIIICASLLGALAMFNQPVDMFVTLLFGVVGYLMDKYDLSKVTLVLGFILGDLAEISYSQSMMISDGNLGIFVSRPISLFLLLLIVGLIALVKFILPALRRRKAHPAEQDVAATTTETPQEKSGEPNLLPFWKNLGFYFVLAIVVWFTVVIVVGSRYPVDALMFPLSVSVLGIALGILTLLCFMFRNVATAYGKVQGSQLFDTSQLKGTKKNGGSGKSLPPLPALLALICWYVGAALLFLGFGYLPGTAIFLFAFLLLYARLPLATCAALTLCVSALVWIIFTLSLGVPPLSGFLA